MLILHVSLPHASLSAPAEQCATPQAGGRHFRTFRFGPFLLQPERQLLLKLDAPVRIGGRALDLLTHLVERAGELVSKQELMSRVWPDTFVEEGNLKVNIAGLRRALGECPAAPRFIATVVGRGYRFIAPVDAFVSPSDRDWRMLPVGSNDQPSYWISSAPRPAEIGQRRGGEGDPSAR
jgi:DNA-binding winged helix-turn-helix (wHTH) protein